MKINMGKKFGIKAVSLLVITLSISLLVKPAVALQADNQQEIIVQGEECSLCAQEIESDGGGCLSCHEAIQQAIEFWHDNIMPRITAIWQSPNYNYPLGLIDKLIDIRQELVDTFIDGIIASGYNYNPTQYEILGGLRTGLRLMIEYKLNPGFPQQNFLTRFLARLAVFAAGFGEYWYEVICGDANEGSGDDPIPVTQEVTETILTQTILMPGTVTIISVQSPILKPIKTSVSESSDTGSILSESSDSSSIVSPSRDSGTSDHVDDDTDDVDQKPQPDSLVHDDKPIPEKAPTLSSDRITPTPVLT